MTDDLKARLRKTTQSGKPNHVSKADRLKAADRIEALELALTQSHAAQASLIEARDWMEKCWKEEKSRADDAEAALTQSRAETAAAYERAAQVDIHYIDDDGEQRSHKLGFFVQNSIRALATPDQTAALDAVRAEARAQGMREAAQLCQTVADEAKGYGIPQMTMGANTCRDAILAAIKGAKA